MSKWALHDAKNRFSEFVDAALAGHPQMVTGRGEPAVAVFAQEEYDRLKRSVKADVPTFGELLAQIPQDDLEFGRLQLNPRDAGS